MPEYDFRCDICNQTQAIQRSIHDDPVAPKCCGIFMNQVYSVPAVKFKGDGFYSTGG